MLRDLLERNTGSYYDALEHIRCIDSFELIGRYELSNVFSLYQYFKVDGYEPLKETRITELDDKIRLFFEMGLYMYDNGENLSFMFKKSHRYPLKMALEMIDLFNETVEYMVSHDDMEGYLRPQE